MRSSSQYSFARVPSVEIPRSSFDRSMTYKSCFDAGYLIPFYCDEALPGDTFNFNLTAFARLATPVVPFMDNLYMDFHFFAVPIRLVWDNFVKMMGEQVDPDDSTDYLVPQISIGQYQTISVGDIYDYMGIPIGKSNFKFSSLWLRAYNLIWNEWYRDENLSDSVPVKRDDLDETYSDYALLPRAKRHDYFTSCLPWPQKGPGVELPIGDYAPVYGDGPLILSDGTNFVEAKTPGSGRAVQFGATGDGIVASHSVSVAGADYTEGENGLYADLSGATGATINTLREAFQIQRLLERDARGGTRYTELLRSHFGVVSPDARLQRPEYLGVVRSVYLRQLA